MNKSRFWSWFWLAWSVGFGTYDATEAIRTGSPWAYSAVAVMVLCAAFWLRQVMGDSE